MTVERKKNNANHRRTTMGIFLRANGRGNGAVPKPAVQRFHARLASPKFAERMTGIFFAAKRAALAEAK